MDVNDLKQHIDGRFDRMESKLDNHLERISKAESDISWIRGFIKISVTIATSIFTGLATLLYNLLHK